MMGQGKREAATLAATSFNPVEAIQIVADRRRVHDPSVRERVTAEALSPGASVQDVALHHGICASLVYRWGRRAVSGDAGPALRLLPVRITDEPVLPSAASGRSPDRSSSLMEIVFADGVRLRVDEAVSPAALRRVVAVLRR